MTAPATRPAADDLTLDPETLADLDASDTDAVVGGARGPSNSDGASCFALRC